MTRQWDEWLQEAPTEQILAMWGALHDSWGDSPMCLEVTVCTNIQRSLAGELASRGVPGFDVKSAEMTKSPR